MYAKEIVTDQNLVKFWDRAIERGTHLEPPQRSKPITHHCWDRWLGVTLNYVYTNRTLRDIGEEYALTPEAVRKIAKRTTKLTWKNCSRSLRKYYPLGRLEVRKISASSQSNNR